MIADRIRTPVNKLSLESCLRHQCRAFRYLIHPRLQFHRLRHMVGAHHIKHAGLRLYHIGAAAAGIRNRVMYPRLIAHVLPQKLHADIHQLHCIQRAPALFRRPRRMGSKARKLILHLNTGIGGTGAYLIHILRMPGERRVQFFKDAVPRHKGFCRPAFLSRTAI